MGIVLVFIRLLPKHQQLGSLAVEVPYTRQTLVSHNQCLRLSINTNITRVPSPSLRKSWWGLRKQRTRHSSSWERFFLRCRCSQVIWKSVCTVRINAYSECSNYIYFHLQYIPLKVTNASNLNILTFSLWILNITKKLLQPVRMNFISRCSKQPASVCRGLDPQCSQRPSAAALGACNCCVCFWQFFTAPHSLQW